MLTLALIHQFTARSMTLFTLIVTVFALFHLLRNRELGGDFWGTVIIGEGLIILQMILGIILVIQRQAPVRPIHYLYGALTVLAWPATFGYTYKKSGRAELLIWFGVSAFLFGLSLRAYSTGGGEAFSFFGAP